MKPEARMLLLFCSLFASAIGYYLHSLYSNDWRQNPVPMRGESYDNYRDRVDSVMRPYVDSTTMKLQFRNEPLNH